MFDRLRKRLDQAGRQDGFTLIELLIVIVILGILAAIVVFAVGGISDRGQTSACKADKKTIQTAQEAYFAEKSAGDGKYAGSVGALVTAKFLADTSSMHTTASQNSGAEYTITPIGDCAP